jgi:hypothetical protein
MADKPSDDRAAFGVFPQLQRNRSRQDREAAKNVPVDLARGAVAGVLGAPGDIESLIRMLPYLDEKTYLPTSEDIEKRLPFRSDTPVSKAATGLGTLGGGFYFGPGSPLKVIGALPGAIKHGAEEFAKASVAGVPYVVKPKGGNWLNRTVENELKPLRRSTSRIASGGDPAQTLREIRERFTPEAIANLPESAGKEHVLQSIDQLEKDIALNSWVDSNLSNYVKKQMATPDDPVRKLAEQNITAFPIAEDTRYWSRTGESSRKQMGGTQMAESDLAKQWENRSDAMIGRDSAQQHQEMMNVAPGMYEKADDFIKNLPPETSLYKTQGMERFNPRDLGFDHILDVLRIDVASGRIRPEQLNKISMEQAVRRTYEFDQEAAKKMREANFKVTEGFPLLKEYPEGYKWIELAPIKTLPEGYKLEPNKGWNKGTYPYRVIGRQGEELFGATSEADAAKTLVENTKRLEEALKYEGATMGHCVGGYCPDVLTGRSRIYSLRDAKGEPHVTIETSPSQKQLRKEDLLPYKEAALEEAKRLPNGYTDADVRDIEIRMARENIPDQIVQIKGKQNAKPKDEYLPFVQDFVKTGTWSDIGDFKNTGLIREGGKIMTPAEHADYLLKELGADTYNELGLGATPPAAGMKRGGKVSISKNPDTMMLEVNNKRIKPVQKAEGGYLKKPAAYINGDEFVNAAKKYGIKDSMNNLNKIVDLVNKGLSVDDAARQVADSGVHKAAGGAINADDLILEERPL